MTVGDDTNKRQLQRQLVLMLDTAFIEIRASESLNSAKKFADIFHGMSLRIFMSDSEESDLEIYQSILDRSKKHNMEEYIHNLRKTNSE